MPELPEVEFARRSLSRWLAGATITRAHVSDARILDEGAMAAGVARALSGRRVLRVERKGKWLRIALAAKAGARTAIVFSHLGMTGKWVAREPGAGAVRFEKVRFEVKKAGTSARGARAVVYVDPRLFGRFVVAKEDIVAWSQLGPDPLHDGIEPNALLARLVKRTIPVKVALLDQRVLAGVGNIQATEALFFARIDPRRASKSVTPREVRALARGIAKSIDETLAAQAGPERSGGTNETGDDIEYVEEPGADNPFTIYGRKGEPCPRCKKPLSKILLGGRGTVFCMRCQK